MYIPTRPPPPPPDPPTRGSGKRRANWDGEHADSTFETRRARKNSPSHTAVLVRGCGLGLSQKSLLSSEQNTRRIGIPCAPRNLRLTLCLTQLCRLYFFCPPYFQIFFCSTQKSRSFRVYCTRREFSMRYEVWLHIADVTRAKFITGNDKVGEYTWIIFIFRSTEAAIIFRLVLYLDVWLSSPTLVLRECLLNGILFVFFIFIFFGEIFASFI